MTRNYIFMEKRNNFFTKQEFGMGLGKINKTKRTYSICLSALKIGQNELKYVPYALRTKELLQGIAISSALKWVPPELKTYELCLDAVKKGKYALLYVPKKHKTEELCIAALRYNFNTAIRYIPKIFMNMHFYRNAVSQAGKIIQFIPEEKKSEFYCSVALESDPEAINYIPDKFKNDIKFLEHVEENRRKVSEMIMRDLQYKTVVYKYMPNPNHDILIASYLIIDEDHLTIGGKEYHANGYDCGNEITYSLDKPELLLTALSKKYRQKPINELNKEEKYYYKNLKSNAFKNIFLYLISIGTIHLKELKKYFEENGIKATRSQIWTPDGKQYYCVLPW